MRQKKRGGETTREGPRHPGPDNTEHRRQKAAKREKKKQRNHSPEGAERTKRALPPARGKGEAQQNAPGGRPLDLAKRST